MARAGFGGGGGGGGGGLVTGPPTINTAIIQCRISFWIGKHESGKGEGARGVSEEV